MPVRSVESLLVWTTRRGQALLDEAEKHIQAEDAAPDAQAMLGYHAYVKSRVTAMQGDTCRAIDLCLAARTYVAADNLDYQIDFSITLGYEYFLLGDFDAAHKILGETIRSGSAARAINNPVAAYCLLARSQVVQGRLHQAEDLLHKAARLMHDAGGHYRGAAGLVEIESAALLCEWNDVDAALVRVKGGLEDLPWWGKADDSCLAFVTLARIEFARGNPAEAAGAIAKAARLVQMCGVFSEARSAVEAAQVRLWLAQGDWPAVDRWAAALDQRFGPRDPFRYEDELARITQARVALARNQPDEAIRLLSRLQDSAQGDGRTGRLIQIILLKALARQAAGDTRQALADLTASLALAEPEGYVRVFLDEGPPMQRLLAKALSHVDAGSLRGYAGRLLSQFDAAPHGVMAAPEKGSPAADRAASWDRP